MTGNGRALMAYYTKHPATNVIIQVQHGGQDLQNATLKMAIMMPEFFAEKEFQRGHDLGSRMREEPAGSADKRLHAACHLMAHQLRKMEKERLDLLVKTMAVHSAARRASHINDNLDRSIKALIQNLRDQKEKHVGLHIRNQDIKLQSQLGTIWVNRVWSIESRP
ncbi:hypothetical protein OG21DRAFT_1527403 [Imleria badia]|nr:hypothetical protein OG21DRAFT_1527403 [Imleria badia]